MWAIQRTHFGLLKFKMADIRHLESRQIAIEKSSVFDEIGTQQQICVSMAVKWPNLKNLESKMADSRHTENRFGHISSGLTDFDEILRGKALFRWISSIGQIPAFYIFLVFRIHGLRHRLRYTCFSTILLSFFATDRTVSLIFLLIYLTMYCLDRVYWLVLCGNFLQSFSPAILLNPAN